jgi:hypothetical protein
MRIFRRKITKIKNLKPETNMVNLVSNVFTDIKPGSRLKRFIFRFISVAGKWVYQGRQRR